MLNNSLDGGSRDGGGSSDIGSIYSREKDAPFLGYSNAYAEGEVDSQKNLTDQLNQQINGVSIHALFPLEVAGALMAFVVLFFLFIICQVCRYKDKPHIQNRSPILILMITFGVFMDTCFKLLIVTLSFQNIDLKCQMAIITRVVFHYTAFLFILIRIQRVHKVKQIQTQLIDEQALNQGAEARLKEKKKATEEQKQAQPQGQKNKKEERLKLRQEAKQERLNKRQFMEEKLEEARMQREERIITDNTINFIVPLTLLGLIANFIPYFLILVPIEESGICWLYYLTRSPYQLESIDPVLYRSSEVVKYLINILEMGLLVVFWFKIRRMLDDKIDIAKESKLMIFFWGFFSVANLALQTVTNHVQDLSYEAEHAVAVVAFIFILVRNVATALIAYIFSIYQVNKKYEDNEQNEEEQGFNLGTLAIDDFDTAMKSNVPVQYFRNFINTFSDYSRLEKEPMAKYGKKYFEIFQLITIYNLMQNKMNHELEKYEKKLAKHKSKQKGSGGQEPLRPQIDQDQKDIIVQIMQMLDKNLEVCFSKQSQNQFFEQFSDLLVVPEERRAQIKGIERRAVKGTPGGDGQSESDNVSYLNSENKTVGEATKSQNAPDHFEGEGITEEDRQAMLDLMEIQSESVPYLSKSTDSFTDCFRFGQLEVMIPFERLDRQDILQSIDLTYYLSECRRILKLIYDKEFKGKHRLYNDLRQYLQKDQLQKNLIQQVFMNQQKKQD